MRVFGINIDKYHQNWDVSCYPHSNCIRQWLVLWLVFRVFMQIVLVLWLVLHMDPSPIWLVFRINCFPIVIAARTMACIKCAFFPYMACFSCVHSNCYWTMACIKTCIPPISLWLVLETCIPPISLWLVLETCIPPISLWLVLETCIPPISLWLVLETCIPPISLWLVLSVLLWLVFGHAYLQLNQSVTVEINCVSIKSVSNILVLWESIYMPSFQTVLYSVSAGMLIFIDSSFKSICKYWKSRFLMIFLINWSC